MSEEQEKNQTTELFNEALENSQTMKLLINAMETMASEMKLLKDNQLLMLSTSFDVENELKIEKQARMEAEEKVKELERELGMKREKQNRVIIDSEIDNTIKKKNWFQKLIG
jgi:hypothetical protein